MNPVLTVVGSGTLAPSANRSSPCHLLEADDARVLLDAGPGAAHALARIGKPWWAVTHVVFSHYHPDHFAGLPHLLFALKWGRPAASRTRPLRIVGPPGLVARTRALRAAYGDFIADPGFETTYHELPRDGRWTDEAASLDVRFAPTPHADHSVAVRVRLGGGTAGYTGDTGPAPEVGRFLAGVDVLVSECAYPDPPPADNHLSPRSVAALARIADPGALVLTHLYPPLDTDADAAPALVRAAGYDGAVARAEDGQAFALGREAAPSC